MNVYFCFLGEKIIIDGEHKAIFALGIGGNRGVVSARPELVNIDDHLGVMTVVRAEVLDELVETYAMHLMTRMDDTRGREHIRTEYGRILRTQLWADPRPTSDLYYTSEERYLTALAVVCDETTAVLRETTPAIFDRRAWAEATDTQKSEREWHADVGWVLNAVATARQIVDDVAARTLRQLEVTVDEDAKDPCHHLTRLAVSVVKAYRTTVDPVDRQRIKEHHIADKTRVHL